jgi:hypothetical protein
VDYEGEESIPRHPLFNIFCARSFEAISHASAYAPAEGRCSVYPINKPPAFYIQQVRNCTNSILLVRAPAARTRGVEASAWHKKYRWLSVRGKPRGPSGQDCLELSRRQRPNPIQRVFNMPEAPLWAPPPLRALRPLVPSQAQKNDDRNMSAVLQTYFNRAFAFERLRAPDFALKDYNTCIRMDPLCCPAFFNRALLYYERCDFHRVRGWTPSLVPG